MTNSESGAPFEISKKQITPIHIVASREQNMQLIHNPETLPSLLECECFFKQADYLSERSTNADREDAVFLTPEHEIDWIEATGSTEGEIGHIAIGASLKEIKRDDVVVLHSHGLPAHLSIASKTRNSENHPLVNDYLSLSDLLLLINGTDGISPPRIFGAVNGSSVFFGVRTDATRVITKLSTQDKLSLIKDFLSFQTSFFGRVILSASIEYLADKIPINFDPLMNLPEKGVKAFNIQFARKHHIALYQIGNIYESTIAKKID